MYIGKLCTYQIHHQLYIHTGKGIYYCQFTDNTALNVHAGVTTQNLLCLKLIIYFQAITVIIDQAGTSRITNMHDTGTKSLTF